MSAPALSNRLHLLVFLTLLGCSKPAEKLFEASTDGSTRSGMLALSDGVVVVNEAGFITRVQADGTTKWRVPMGRQLASRAVEAKGVVVATSVAGEWFGINALTGTVPWEVPRQPITRADLATDGLRVYAIVNDGSIRCIDAASGAVVWTKPGPGPAGKTPVAAPVIAGNSVIAAVGDAGILAVGWEDGAQRWRSEVVALSLVPSRDRASLFAAGKEGALTRLDARTGAVQWTRKLGAEITATPTVAGELLYVGLGEKLVALDPSSGEERWSAEAGAPVAPVARVGGTLVVPTSGQDGQVLLYAPPATRPYATFRVDSPVRAAPVVLGDRVLLLASDGRVLGYRLRAEPR